MTHFSKKIIYLVLIGLLFSYGLVLVIPLSARAQSSGLSMAGTHELLIKLKNHEQIYKIIYPDSTDIFAMQKLVQKMPNVDLAEPDYLLQASYVPNDPFYVEQWNFDKIGAPKAWDIVGGGSASVVVAVLDTGVDIDHPDLKNNIWTNPGEIPGNGVDDDKNGYIDDFVMDEHTIEAVINYIKKKFNITEEEIK